MIWLYQCRLDSFLRSLDHRHEGWWQSGCSTRLWCRGSYLISTCRSQFGEDIEWNLSATHRCLLESVQWLLESVDCGRMLGRFEHDVWVMKTSSSNSPCRKALFTSVWRRCHHLTATSAMTIPNSRHLCHRAKGLLIVKSVRLSISLSYKSCLVAVHWAVDIIFDFIYPPTNDRFLVWILSILGRTSQKTQGVLPDHFTKGVVRVRMLRLINTRKIYD